MLSGLHSAAECTQVQRAARFGPCARQTTTTKRLHADHRADLIAIDIDITDLRTRSDLVRTPLDARVHAERESITRGVDFIQNPIQLICLKRRHMHDWAELLLAQIHHAIDRHQGRRHEVTFVRMRTRHRHSVNDAAAALLNVLV